LRRRQEEERLRREYEAELERRRGEKERKRKLPEEQLINLSSWPGLCTASRVKQKSKSSSDCWQSVFLSKFSRDYEARRFSPKGNGTGHGRGTHAPFLTQSYHT